MINFYKILRAQAEIDKLIMEKAGLTKYKLFDVELALKVELGELANEWQGFKFWKANKKINREKMLEEWADCMAFACSIENYSFKIIALNKAGEEDINNAGKETLEDISEQIYCKEIDPKREQVLNALNVRNMFIHLLKSSCVDIAEVVVLGELLGFTHEEMEQAYFKKRDKNLERIRNGY